MKPVPAFPSVLEVELIRDCNLACRMCLRQAIPDFSSKRKLGPDLLTTILEQCGEHPLQINLGGLGESLLHKRLPALLAQIKTHNPGIRTGFNTNGVLLDPSRYHWMLDGRVDYLTISLNAPSRNDYRWLITSDHHDRVVSNTQQFLEIKGPGAPPHTTVHVFDIPRFTADSSAWSRHWHGLADFVQVRALGNWAGHVGLDEFGVEPVELGICERPWYSLAIDLDGAYHRCCATFAIEQPEITVDMISLQEFWQGVTMKSRRSTMTHGTFGSQSPCQSCSGRAIMPNSVIEQRSERIDRLCFAGSDENVAK